MKEKKASAKTQTKSVKSTQNKAKSQTKDCK